MANQLKVYAYVTRGRRLLVFTHPRSPEAGLQVPGGSVKSGESPEDAVMREVREETGLTDLNVIGFLGETSFRRPLENYKVSVSRRFYHLRFTGTFSPGWRHWEADPSEGEAPCIPFDFFWVDLTPDVPALAADLDQMIPELLISLGRDPN